MISAGLGTLGIVGPSQYSQSPAPSWDPLLLSLSLYWRGVYAGHCGTTLQSLYKCKCWPPLPSIVPLEALSPGCPYVLWGSGLRWSRSVLLGLLWTTTCVGLASAVSPIKPGQGVLNTLLGIPPVFTIEDVWTLGGCVLRPCFSS